MERPEFETVENARIRDERVCATPPTVARHSHHLYYQMLMDVDNLDQTNVDESLLPDPTSLRNRGKSSSLNVTVDDAHPFDLDSYISAYKGIQGGVSCG